MSEFTEEDVLRADLAGWDVAFDPHLAADDAAGAVAAAQRRAVAACAADRRNPAHDRAGAWNATGQGLMVPLGDAKGIALALMVEILAAGLTGANFAAEAGSFLDDKGDPPGTGQFIIAIDPQAFADNVLEQFAELARSVEEQQGARRMEGSRHA